MRQFRVAFATLTAAVVAVIAFSACAAGGPEELTVFVAASLRDAFDEVAQAFEQSNPDTEVILNFAGSQVLRAQIERGARSDVFASANHAHLDALSQAGLLGASPRVFAQNELVLAIPAENPGNITTLPDIAAPDAQVVMGVPDVPVGRYARQMLTKYAEATGQSGFPQTVLDGADSFETNVRLIAAKLELGVADAGLIYRTDVLAAAGALVEIPLPPEVTTRAPYPIAVTATAQAPEVARAFVDFVLSPAGQKILSAHGFEQSP